MSFDWHEYEVLARLLAGDSDVDISQISDDARRRTAISRAYYASLHVAREFIEIHLGLILKNSASKSLHTQVINTYRDDENLTYIAVGENLNRLRLLRVQADYEKEMSKIRSKTRDALTFARDIFDNIEKLKNS